MALNKVNNNNNNNSNNDNIAINSLVAVFSRVYCPNLATPK